MRSLFLVGLALFAGLGACSNAAAPRPEAAPTTVALVRHAEKVLNDGTKDPPLTEEGNSRALQLKSALADLKIDAVYCTQYQRTRATVAPLAEALGIVVRQVEADATRAFAAQLLAEHRGQTVLAAAHSDTIPEILTALGIGEPITIGDNDYGDVFLVTIDAAGKATLNKRRFGE